METYKVTRKELSQALRFAGKLWTDRRLAERGWGDANPSRELVAVATARASK